MIKHRMGRPKSDRPKVDVGTPELIAKRLAASPDDPTLSTTPIDVVKSREIISEEAYGAVCYFAALRKMVFGKAHPGAIDLTAVSGSTPDEFDTAEAETKYRDACLWMKAQSPYALNAVESLVVHEHWPAWLVSNQPIPNARDYHYFGLGVAALLGWYKNSMRRAA